MSFTVENLEKNMAKLTITVSADDFEKALQNGKYVCIKKPNWREDFKEFILLFFYWRWIKIKKIYLDEQTE